MPFQFTCVRCGSEFTRTGRLTPLKQPYKYCSMACQHPVRPLLPQDDETVLVPLGRDGKFAIIDAVDAERVAPFNWSYRTFRGREYAIRALPGYRPRRNIFMHVELMAPLPEGIEVDHVDGNGLNNRSVNLRQATHSQNVRNTPGRSRSGYKGVSLNQCSGRWLARIHVSGKRRSLGCYDTPEEAAGAYDAAALDAWGEFAWLNFPHDDSR